MFLYMHLAPASESLRNSPSITEHVMELRVCQPDKVVAPNCSPISFHCHPLSSWASHSLPVWTAASITYLASPCSPAVLSSSHSLPLPQSHQSGIELSLVMMPQGMSLGSMPHLTSVVATPHPSGMLHFWNDGFGWHNPGVLISMNISRLRSMPTSTPPVSTSGKVNIRREPVLFC